MENETTLILTAVLVVVNQLVSGSILRKISSPVFAILVFPGLLVHELGHAVIGTLLGLKVRKISITSTIRTKASSGFVLLEGPKSVFTTLRMGVASLAPLASGGGCLYVIVFLVGGDSIATTLSSSIMSGDVSRVAAAFAALPWWSTLLAPVVYSLAISTPPSAQDMKNAMPLLVPVAATSPFWWKNAMALVPQSFWNLAFSLAIFVAVSSIFIRMTLAIIPKKKRG